MNVVVIPEIKNIFLKSQNVSFSKEKSHFLLWNSQINRKSKHPEEEMIVDEDQYKKIENKIDKYKSQQEDLLNDREKLVKLYQEGIIDSDGEYKEQ